MPSKRKGIQSIREARRFALGSGKDSVMRLSPKARILCTPIVLMEGVQLDLTLLGPKELGHRAMAMVLSDLAVAGAEPEYCKITLGLKQDTSNQYQLELESGLQSLARRFGVRLDFSPPVLSPNALSIYIAALGQQSGLGFAREPRPGDLLAITGSLAGSSAGLRCMKVFGRYEMRNHEALLQRHIAPIPRVEQAWILRQSGAVVGWREIADGLANELHGFCEQYAVGCLIDESKIPISKEATKAAEMLGTPESLRNWALFGPEDYELLVGIPKKSFASVEKKLRKTKTPLTVVGEVTEEKKGVQLKTPDGETVALQNKLWHPFVRRRKA